MTFPLVRLGDMVTLNPKHDKAVPDSLLVSFLPMSGVDDQTGTIQGTTDRPLGDVRHGYTHMADGDVIFAKITPCMENGKCAVVHGMTNGLGCGSTEFFVLRPKADLLPEYLHAFLRQKGYRNRAQAAMTGAVGQARVPKQFLLSSEIPLPPLSEQRRIVADVNQMRSRNQRVRFALTKSADAIPELTRSIYRSYFSRFSTAQVSPASGPTAADYLVRIAQLRRPRWGQLGLGGTCPTATGASPDQPELPPGWLWATIDQLAFVGTGATPKRTEPRFWETGNVPWVSSGAVNSAKVSEASGFVTEAAVSETNLTVYPPGTILMAMYGEGRTRGMCAELAISAATNQALAAIQLVDNSPEMRGYVLHYLKSRYEDTRRSAAGGVQPNLNLSIVRQIPVPVPPPSVLPKIVASLDESTRCVIRLTIAIEASVMDLERMNQAVLARAFGGQ